MPLMINTQPKPYSAIVILLFLVLSATPTDADELPQMSALPNDSCEAARFSIDLTVHNVRKAEGLITVDVHDGNPDGFLNNDGLVDRVRTPAQEDTTRVCISVGSEGTYAIAVYHDRDADFTFDKNWLGLPREPYGISNDPPIRLGPPPHSAAAFAVVGSSTPIKVTLRGK